MRIIPRAEWGNRYGVGWRIRPLPATSAWLHHSVTNAPGPNATLAQDIAHMRVLDEIGYNRFKYADTGWSRPAGAGISYTAVIMPSGRIFEGHDINRASSHTSGHNTPGIGICIAGNYDNQEPTPAALESAAWVLAEFRRRGHLRTARYDGGHRDTGFATACPGARLHRKIGAINTRAAQLDKGGAVKPSPAPPPRVGTWPAGWIANAQRLLNELGYTDAQGKPLAVDDSLGPATTHATRTYQADAGLDPDGQPGAATTTSLEDTMSEVLKELRALRAEVDKKPTVGQIMSFRHSKPEYAGRDVHGHLRDATTGLAATLRVEAALAEANGHQVDTTALAEAMRPILEDAVRAAVGEGSADAIVDELAKRLAPEGDAA